jgi:hypothetical protein
MHDGPSRCGGHGCTIGHTPCGVVHLFRVAPRLLEQLGRLTVEVREDFERNHVECSMARTLRQHLLDAARHQAEQ